VHCLTLGAPKAESQCRDVSARTGGMCVCLPALVEVQHDANSDALSRLVETLGNLPRRQGELSPEAFLDASARVIQHAYRARVQRLKRLKVVRYKAALRIAAAYSRWRLRRCLREAAREAKRERRRAPVAAAQRARADAAREVEMGIAARKLQTYWRARKITLWCQRIDKAARRLQRMVRRRNARFAAAKWRKMQILKRVGAADPPPIPPSQWLVPEKPVEKEEPEEPQQEGFVLGKRQPQAWETQPRDHLRSSMCPAPQLRGADRPRERGDDTAALLPPTYAAAGIMPPPMPRDASMSMTMESPRRRHMSPRLARATSPSNRMAATMQLGEPSRAPRLPLAPPSPRHETTNFKRRVPLGRPSRRSMDRVLM